MLGSFCCGFGSSLTLAREGALLLRIWSWLGLRCCLLALGVRRWSNSRKEKVEGKSDKGLIGVRDKSVRGTRTSDENTGREQREDVEGRPAACPWYMKVKWCYRVSIGEDLFVDG